MRGFQERADVAAVLRLLEERLHPLSPESAGLDDAANRVLAEDVIAGVPVPGFARSAMDGYALDGSSTFGADLYNPLEFTVIGLALPGKAFAGTVKVGEAVRIMTGAPLPPGADAVVPVEATTEITQTGGVVVRVSEAVPPGRHVGQVGEDIKAGSTVLTRGRVLRPQDVGVLASLGVGEVPVVRRPTVAIVVSGDELLPPGARPEGVKIVDSNSVMLKALAHRDGAGATRVLMVPDGRDPIRQALQECAQDVILVSGATSVGQEDHAPQVLAELGELAVHGVALRPASPTGVGFLGARPVFLLPGNPVSCLCAYDLFAGPALRRLGGRSTTQPYPRRALPLARKIVSMVGRFDYVRVSIVAGLVEPLAISGASILSSTTRADGFVLVPADLEGYAEGTVVEVFLYDAV
jgi:molybdopterin molybdotransferase